MKNSLVLTLVVLLMACSDQEQVMSKEQLNRGKEIYLDSCAVCHGVNGDGEGIALPALKVKPQLIYFWKSQYDEISLKAFIENSPDHPVFPNELKYDVLMLYSKSIEP